MHTSSRRVCLSVVLTDWLVQDKQSPAVSEGLHKARESTCTPCCMHEEEEEGFDKIPSFNQNGHTCAKGKADKVCMNV